MEDKSSTGSNWIAGVEPERELLTQSMNSIYEMECREQPTRLASLLDTYQVPAIREELDKLREMSLSTGPVLFIGMGASYCSSISGSSYLQSCGRPSFTVDAGEWLHYSGAWEQVALSLLVTTSGESAELVQLCRMGAQRPLALLCNNEKSACWSLVRNRLPILAGPADGGRPPPRLVSSLPHTWWGADGRKPPSGCYGRPPPISITYSVCETR